MGGEWKRELSHRGRCFCRQSHSGSHQRHPGATSVSTVRPPRRDMGTPTMRQPAVTQIASAKPAVQVCCSCGSTVQDPRGAPQIKSHPTVVSNNSVLDQVVHGETVSGVR